MSHSKSNLFEYGITGEDVSTSATPTAPEVTAVQYPTMKPPPKLPAAVMPTSMQNACIQKARVFEWVSKIKFGKQASDKNLKRAVFMLAMKNARPLRKRAGSAPASVPNKYRPVISNDLMRVWDYVVSVYTPDKNGKYKHTSSFDGGGQFKFNTKKVAKQLDIPLRTLQRYLAKLDAMRLLDRYQIPTRNTKDEYRGSTIWILLRADVYMGYLRQVLIQRSIGKVARNDEDKPVVEAEVTVSEPEPQGENQASETKGLEGNRDDNVVISLCMLMEPPSSGFEKQETQSPSTGSSSFRDYSGAAAPAARPPQNFSFVSGKENPITIPAEAHPVSTPLSPSTPGDTTPAPGKVAAPVAVPQDVITPVAPIDPATVLELGDLHFQALTRRLAKTFSETQLTVSHCHQLKSWMMRSSPYERMTYEDLDAILVEHESGCRFQSLTEKNYHLTLDWLVKAWPQILRKHRHEQLEQRNAGEAVHNLEMMTTRAEAEFEANIQNAVKCIYQNIVNNGSDKYCNAAKMFTGSNMLYGFIALHLMGKHDKVDEAVNPIWLDCLKNGISESPLDALLARAKYPELMARCGFEQKDWNRMKEQVKEVYQRSIGLKAEAERWQLPLLNYATVSDKPSS